MPGGAAGSSLEQVLKCNVYCTSVEVLAELGVVFLLFDIGLHVSLRHVREQAATPYLGGAGVSVTFFSGTKSGDERGAKTTVFLPTPSLFRLKLLINNTSRVGDLRPHLHTPRWTRCAHQKTFFL